MKGLFIPGITAKMFRDASLESVAELMAEGKVYDIDYQEPCEDAISRKEVLEYIDKMPSRLTPDGRRMIRRRTLEKCISELSPIIPQPKIDILKIDVLKKVRAEIKGWQVDIHDNENDADEHDFVFEQIFEIIDKYIESED